VHLATVTPITAAQSYSNLTASNMVASRGELQSAQSTSAITYSAVTSSVSNHSHHPQGPAHEQSFELDRPLREARDDFERAYFEFHLAREGGSMTRVAEKTGLERTHLYRKLKQLGVDLGRSKKSALN
jgi:DNA-binding NtrC family response regulator